MPAPLPKGKWSWKFDKCRECDTKRFKHKGRGLCTKCWDVDRKKNPHRKQILKQNHDRWYARVRQTEEYQKYVRESAARWRKESKRYPLFLERQYIRQRYRRIAWNLARGTGRNLKKNEGIQYRCDICPDGHLVTSPVRMEDTKNLFIWHLELFKKEVAKVCRARVGNVVQERPRHEIFTNA